MIAICTPTRDDVHALFAQSLINLQRRSPDVRWLVSFGTILPNLRSELVMGAFNISASHVLFIDSDMVFPPDTVQRLLSHDLDIVAANCIQRQRLRWTARKDQREVESLDRVGLEEVTTVGFGVTLIKTSVFNKLQVPWFDTPWDGARHMGEDIYFCQLANHGGYKIFIDHDLSQEVGHVGTKQFTVNDME